MQLPIQGRGPGELEAAVAHAFAQAAEAEATAQKVEARAGKARAHANSLHQVALYMQGILDRYHPSAPCPAEASPLHESSASGSKSSGQRSGGAGMSISGAGDMSLTGTSGGDTAAAWGRLGDADEAVLYTGAGAARRSPQAGSSAASAWHDEAMASPPPPPQAASAASAHGPQTASASAHGPDAHGPHAHGPDAAGEPGGEEAPYAGWHEEAMQAAKRARWWAMRPGPCWKIPGFLAFSGGSPPSKKGNRSRSRPGAFDPRPAFEPVFFHLCFGAPETRGHVQRVSLGIGVCFRGGREGASYAMLSCWLGG